MMMRGKSADLLCYNAVSQQICCVIMRDKTADLLCDDAW